jgi:hypothetical protein
MILPPPGSLPPEAEQAMQAAYARPGGSLDLEPYMDLLAVHEVGHLFLDQAAGRFDTTAPRRWLVELFCNLGLHAYVAAEAPGQMPALVTFPQIVVGGGYAHLTHQALADFEALYAGMEPPNFVWYLSRLHVAAAALYEAGGLETLQRLWALLISGPGRPSDDQLAATLHAQVHPEAARLLTRWPD